MVAIVGQSGAGKSHVLATFWARWTRLPRERYILRLYPTLAQLSEREAGSLFAIARSATVWQFHYLLPEFTTLWKYCRP